MEETDAAGRRVPGPGSAARPAQSPPSGQAAAAATVAEQAATPPRIRRRGQRAAQRNADPMPPMQRRHHGGHHLDTAPTARTAMVRPKDPNDPPPSRRQNQILASGTRPQSVKMAKKTIDSALSQPFQRLLPPQKEGTPATSPLSNRSKTARIFNIPSPKTF